MPMKDLPDWGAPWEPWFDYDDEGFITEAGVDTKDRRANVCVAVTTENVEIDDKELFNAYVIRDTNLLAAAPDLLKACEAMLAAFRKSSGLPVSLNAAYEAIHDAVCKAKGGAS